LDVIITQRISSVLTTILKAYPPPTIEMQSHSKYKTNKSIFNTYHSSMTKTQKDHPLQIRNSTAEFLMFTADTHQNSIEVRFQDETVRLSQKMMALLFDVSIPTINEHLRHLRES
jgi:hypothetical protein